MDKFPILLVDDPLDELQGSSTFIRLDLKSRYNQTWMNEANMEKTAFQTHMGHYEFLGMPFKMKNALVAFQSLMNHSFGRGLWKFVLVFFLTTYQCTVPLSKVMDITSAKYSSSSTSVSYHVV